MILNNFQPDPTNNRSSSCEIIQIEPYFGLRFEVSLKTGTKFKTVLGLQYDDERELMVVNPIVFFLIDSVFIYKFYDKTL